MRHRIMKVVTGFIVSGMAFGFLSACDGGDKVIDEATGNRALEQYKMTKEKLNTLDEKQKEKYRTIPGDETQERKE